MEPQHSILVVDDEAEVVKSLTHLLRTEYKVIGACSAAQAIECLKQEPIQVIMTDQRMAAMTGAELLRTVHQQYPDVIRLLFTGYADIKAMIDAINEGHVYRYITKPWDPEELLTILRDACRLYDLTVERSRLVRELCEKNAELKQADALKSAFIKVASHEFRTPVTILSGLSKLALLNHTASDEISESLGQIDSAVERLQHLVDQTLEMLSAERFHTICHRNSEDVAALIRLAAADIRPFIASRRQHLHLALDDALGSMHLDGPKIRDCLNHLLINAIKFTPDGGSITVSVRRVGTSVTIDVTDTGAGIPDECIPRMFEAFFTGFDVSRHTSGNFEHGARGLGLGLSIVRAFVDLHGGTVRVKSKVGSGSTFTIELPEVADR